MLLRLFISNYALIQKLDIDWSGGLVVITGETGAGKSILVGALSLILGNRADTTILLSHQDKCIVEGQFSIDGYGLETFFLEHDLDYEPVVTLRREISQTGKSRAFINDTPVSLANMKDLGDRLVNIHSQHSITTLHQADFQLTVLDDFASHLSSVQTYRKQFAGYRNLQQYLNSTREKIRRNQTEREYKQYILGELLTAALRTGEQEELEFRLNTLTHAEDIKRNTARAAQLLSLSDDNILLRLTESLSLLNPVASYQQNLLDLRNRIESDLIDLKDIATALEQVNENLDFDPLETERISGRLDLVYRLQQKHHCSSIQDLMRLTTDLEQSLKAVEEDEEQVLLLEQQEREVSQHLEELANQLSSSRLQAIPGFEKEIESMLRDLGMPAASFHIECTRKEKLSEDGYDQVKFLFSANKGIPLDDVARIASGGELSRLMLSIKSMISRRNLLPTIIFDEIDNGVSGEIAGKVGAILKRIAQNMQVIVITHLPQIAGMGTHHYWVFKESSEETTRSNIRRLSWEERIEEIAKMVSNEKVTAAAYQTARELLAT